MRFQIFTVALALLPFATCRPSVEVVAVEALDIRAAKPAPIVEAPKAAPTSFVVQSFEAWMPLSSYKGTMKSRAIFQVSLFPPIPGWSATCWTTTKDTLCDPNVWYSCTEPAENESVMFRFGHDLTSMDIKRRWTSGKTTMTVTASKSAEWNESVNPLRQNVTVSQWGKCYKRPNGWKFDWQTMVA